MTTTNVYTHKIRNLLARNVGDDRWLDLDQVILNKDSEDEEDEGTLIHRHLLDKNKGSWNTPVYFNSYGEIKPITNLSADLLDNIDIKTTKTIVGIDSPLGSSLIGINVHEIPGEETEDGRPWTIYGLTTILDDVVNYGTIEDKNILKLNGITVDQDGNIESTNGKISADMIPDEMQGNVVELESKVTTLQEDIEELQQTSKEVYIGKNTPKADNFRIWIRTDEETDDDIYNMYPESYKATIVPEEFGG